MLQKHHKIVILSLEISEEQYPSLIRVLWDIKHIDINVTSVPNYLMKHRYIIF